MFKTDILATEHGFEIEQETLAQKILARRTFIFAMEVSEQLELAELEAHEYAYALVELFKSTQDDDIVIEQVLTDLRRYGIIEHYIVLENKLYEAEQIAQQQILLLV